MNYFAHALPFLDRPYFMTGTGVPDWLAVVDRRVRVRSKHVRKFLDDPDLRAAAVAAGILQHLLDDDRFHTSRAFAEVSLELTVLSRDLLEDDSGLQPRFMGHLLVEVLLDAALIAEKPGKLEEYYRVLDEVDPAVIEQTVNRVATRPTERLAWMISEFRRIRILWDYLEDAKLMRRLNQVMRRVGLPQLPEAFADLLPSARQLVARRRGELLDGIPTSA